MRATLLFLAAFFSLSAAIEPLGDPPKVLLKVAVIDELGAGIPGARIVVHWDPSGSNVGLESNVGIKEDLSLTTDHEGKVSVLLPPGFYDVFLSATSFTPNCRKLRLKLNQRGHFEAVKLRVDPLVTKELGDEITAPSK